MRLAYLENKNKQTKLECATKGEIERSKTEGARGRQGSVWRGLEAVGVKEDFDSQQ